MYTCSSNQGPRTQQKSSRAETQSGARDVQLVVTFLDQKVDRSVDDKGCGQQAHRCHSQQQHVHLQQYTQTQHSLEVVWVTSPVWAANDRLTRRHRAQQTAALLSRMSRLQHTLQATHMQHSNRTMCACFISS
jgi:hypothetical protein